MTIENINNIAEAVLGCCSEALRNDDSGHMSCGIWSGSREELLKTPLNFCFRSAVIKYPSFVVTHGEVSGIIQMVQENSLPKGKVMTLAQNTDDGDYKPIP